MNIDLYIDVHGPNFLHHFCCENLVSGVGFQVSGKVDGIAYPER